MGMASPQRMEECKMLAACAGSAGGQAAGPECAGEGHARGAALWPHRLQACGDQKKCSHFCLRPEEIIVTKTSFPQLL